MSLDPPTYLSSLQNNIRARLLPWDGAVRAGTITETQLGQIRAVDKVRPQQRQQVVEADLHAYRALFVGGGGQPGIFESASRRGDVVQYILVLLGDLLEGSSALAKALAEHPDPFRAFVPLLSQSNNNNNSEDPIPLLTSEVITSIISSSDAASPKSLSAIPRLLTYLSTLANSSDAGLQDIAVQQYSTLLRSKQARQLFWKQRQETLGPLVAILRTAAGVGSNGDSSTLYSGAPSIRNGSDSTLGGGIGLQLLYHILLVFWQLSFEGESIGEDMQENYEIIPLFTQLLRLSPKEKTTRLLVSSLYNILSVNQQALLPAAVLVRLPALLQNLNGRHLTDQDLLDDLSKLTEMLEDYTKTQTTLDEYVAEVNSGHLRWSPPHRNSAFWTENARKILEHEQGDIPRKLADIMKKPWDSDKQVLAVACNDVGWLVKEVPEKRAQLEKLGLKTRVMELMTESDESVRWESLNALSGWLRYSFETK